MDEHALRNEVARMRSALQLIRILCTKPTFSEGDKATVLNFVEQGLKSSEILKEVNGYHSEEAKIMN